MAFEIVDGMTGTKHISSDDLSALNVATIGKANCVLKYGDDFKLTMASANSATLGTGVGMVGGKRFWNQAATSLTVQSGTQGQKRNDLVVARYAKTSAGIESITPVVVKGTPSTGTAADPATTSNDLKLWRIPLNGISVGTPVRLFDPVASLATLGDLVSKQASRVITGKMSRPTSNTGWIQLWDSSQVKREFGVDAEKIIPVCVNRAAGSSDIWIQPPVLTGSGIWYALCTYRDQDGWVRAAKGSISIPVSYRVEILD